jgi:UDP-3-O-[3-hydroxymyristoyl] glucosamine N-acyltransferase
MVPNSITEPGRYTGYFPVARNAEWERNAVIVRNLTSMREKIRALEKTIKTLTEQK